VERVSHKSREIESIIPAVALPAPFGDRVDATTETEERERERENNENFLFTYRELKGFRRSGEKRGGHTDRWHPVRAIACRAYYVVVKREPSRGTGETGENKRAD